MRIVSFSYRFAMEVLDSAQFKDKKRDIVQIFKSISDIPRRDAPKLRERTGATFATDTVALNALLDKAFEARGWQCQPLVTGDQVTKIKADYHKERVQVEVQFGNMARWYTDVFKFQVSYSLGRIDVGVLVIPTQSFSRTIDENVAYYERVIRELPYAKMSITLPIWVLGIEPKSA